MKLSDLSQTDLIRRARHRGLDICVGPYVLRFQTTLNDLARAVGFLYAEYPLDEAGFADFHVRLTPPKGPRRWWRPQVEFHADGRAAFTPFPRRLALPLLEWGLNASVMDLAHQYLNVHSAVIERGGFAAIFPGAPGAGKSTLCAALVNRGWRLLSDEMALVRPDDGQLVPIPRPVNLKNQSIDLIRAFAPEARFGPRLDETNKGTICHMRAPTDSVHRAHETAQPAWIIFPQYTPGAAPEFEPLPKTRFLMHVADNSFNYSMLGVRGFETLARLIDACSCMSFRYDSLNDAAEMFASLKPPPAADPAAA